MSNPGAINETPITSVKQLADYIAAGCKPKTEFRIGTEHEKFGFRLTDHSPPPYEAAGDPASIRGMLEGLAQHEATPILDEGRIIGLRQGRASISLEPAGQLELSGALVDSLHEARAELDAHLAQVRTVGASIGLGFAPLGFHPTASRDAMPWMPKGRYAVMRRYMPRVGSLGLDMMTRTCTVQVNLDYRSEEDMLRKLRMSLMLQPLATALFANSPFTEGRPNGFLSYRAHVWTDTDPDRSGMPAVMFEPGFGFERYAEWLVDQVPMYFVYRDGRYIDVAGRRFRDFIAGRLPELAGVVPTVGDFADHMTTVFTDVRLKQFLEMRGADAGRPDMLMAQSALWVGLLYDEASLTETEALLKGHGREDALALRAAVPRQGLSSPWGKGSLRSLAGHVIAIARSGLRARGRQDAAGRDESIYIEPIEKIAAGAPTQAEYWLQRNQDAWEGEVTRIFFEAAI